MRAKLTLLGALIVLLWASGTRTHACDCLASGPACEETWRADAVFLGQVVAITGSNPGDKASPYRASMKVSEVFRGEVPATAVISSGFCGFSFEAGESYLVYARRGPDGAFRAGGCSRTALLSKAADDLVYLRGLAQRRSTSATIIGQAVHVQMRKDALSWSWYAGGRVVVTPIDPGNRNRYETLTGADGKFSVSVPTGRYSVTLAVREGLYAQPEFLSPVEVVDVRGCGHAPFILFPDGRISGRMLDAEGRPVPNLSIDIMRVDGLPAMTPDPDSTRTDAAGVFEFARLHPASYAVGVMIHFSPGARESNPMWFSEPNHTGRRIISLEPEERAWMGNVQFPNSVQYSTIDGLVSSPDGLPATAATVYVMPAGTHSSAGSIKVDANGRFTFTVIAGRKYFVRAVEPRADGRSAMVDSPEFTAETGRMQPISLQFSSIR